MPRVAAPQSLADRCLVAESTELVGGALLPAERLQLVKLPPLAGAALLRAAAPRLMESPLQVALPRPLAGELRPAAELLEVVGTRPAVGCRRRMDAVGHRLAVAVSRGLEALARPGAWGSHPARDCR